MIRQSTHIPTKGPQLRTGSELSRLFQDLQENCLTNMKGIVCLTLVAMIVISELFPVNCQTFQYSRGWTNGRKRSHGQPSAAELLARKVLQLAWPDHEQKSLEQFSKGCKYPNLCMESADGYLGEKLNNFQQPSSSEEALSK